jgi:hypothetical protein
VGGVIFFVPDPRQDLTVLAAINGDRSPVNYLRALRPLRALRAMLMTPLSSGHLL